MSAGESTWLRRPSSWILAITLFAGLVRLIYIDWDQRHFFHPDERRVAYAVEELSFQPLQLNPKFFAYGSLPIYLTKIATSLLGLVDPRYGSYDQVIHTGRAVSGVIGTLTVLFTILLGIRLYDRSVGLLAGFLLAACVLHVQNSHFSTVDIALTFLVLLALFFLIGVVRRGRTSDYVYAGLAIGFAGATKASAFPLMLPFAIAAAYRLGSGDRFGSVVLRLLTGTVSVVVAFAIGQPYALLDFAAFTHDLVEQSHMVRNAGVFPYTNQYVGAPKYVYELTQIVLIGMAPPLGLAAIWASAKRVVAIWRQRAEEVVLLAWVVPFFLVTGWFEVKFIRYLLPIYPIMILWAAEWIMRVHRAARAGERGALGRLLLPTVVAGTALALLAFLSIYTRPHTVVEASEWLYKFVPTGSKILSQDWDEGFPMPLPGYHPERYKVVDFGYYEPDSPAKIQKLGRQLAESDYVAFQTKRLYGALTQAAQKFPLSSNYFYLLFSGDLGFTLIHEIASRPGLFGFEVPDELWDESFSVYDHPKVLIFRNDGRLSAEAISEKIMLGLPSQQLTRNDLLLARPGAAVGGAASEPVNSSIPALLTFAALVELLGLATYPLLRRRLAGASPYALAKVFGILFLVYPPWLLVSLGQAELSRATLAITLLILLAAGLTSWWRGRTAAPPHGRAEAIAAEVLFWGAFAFFLGVRAYNPEVYWGEKPMDFAFLNAITRATTLPPPEPWFAGHDLNYSYFGYYVTAALGKVCHIAPAITFNLAIALFGGLAAVAAFALGNVISGRWHVGVVTALLTVLLGNLAGPRELFQRGTINFDYFWATSRVIRETINEYPLWSFLFADLHAHVMAMPFSLTFITLSVAWARRRFVRRDAETTSRLTFLLLLGLTLGTIMVTNAWSTPTYVLFFPFLLGCHWIGSGTGRRFGTFALQLFTRVLPPAVAAVLIAYALYLPFWLEFTPPERNWGWQVDVFVRPRDYAQIFGLFLYVLVPFLFFLWYRRLKPRALALEHNPVAPAVSLPATDDPAAAAEGDDLWQSTAVPEPELVMPPPAATLPPAAVAVPRKTRPRFVWLRMVLLLAVAAGVAAATYVSTRSALVLLAVLALQLAVQHRTSERQRVALAMASFAFFVTAGCDVIYVWDRMNTIFKFYLDSWFLFAAAAAVAAADLWRGRVVRGWLRRVWQAGLLALLAVAAFTGVSATYGVITTHRVQTPKPTLNGMRYLEQRAPHELAAYEWLNRRIPGIPVVVEAYGPSYQEFAHVSMNTGLPTVLGWDYHVFQRAHPWADINRRKADIKLIYTSDNKGQVRAALERYHVALLYLGALERRTYPGVDMTRFNAWTDLLTPIYENAAVTIFAVNGQFTGAIPVTTIEQVPQVTEAETPPQQQDQEGQFRQPRGVAIDSTGAVYVCDFGNNRIQKLSRELEILGAWGERGDLPAQFKDPCGIAVAPSGDVYIADTWNHRVQVLSADGEYVREWAPGFYGPRGIAIDDTGSVFVTDSGNNRVMRFNASGDLETAWGSKGDGPGQFLEPIGVAVDRAGQVYVCDNANARVQIFTRDGGFVRSFAVPGWESKVYSEPYIAVEADGTIWVTVPLAKQLRAYDPSGKLLRTISPETTPGVAFDTPIGIAIDASAKELVVSDIEHRVLRLPHEKPK